MLKVATTRCSSHAAFGAHLRRGEPPSPLLRLILGRNNRTPYIIRSFFCSDSTDSSEPDDASAARVKSPANLVRPEDCLTVIALPLSHRPLFPGFYMPVYVKDPKLLSALVESRKRQALYTGAFLVKDEEEAEGSDSDKNIYDLKGKELFDRLREVGTLAQITSIQGDQVVLIGHRRLRITEMVSEDPLTVKVDHLKEIPYDKDDDILEATSFEVISTLRDVLKTSPLWRDHAQTYIQHVGDFTYPRVADFVAAISGANKQQCQQVLEELDVHKRLKLTLELLKKEMEISKIQELGLETDDKTALSAKFRERLDPKKEKIPAHVLQVIEEELPKLQLLEASSSEFNVTRNYLDWLTAFPWGEYSDENFDVIRAQEILDEDHYGLTDVKERILEFIAVGKLRGISQGKIICRSGLPGVGKTSIDRSIARALSRKFYRFSVGGLSDVAEIRGHRRTYIGAMHLEVIKDADVVDVKSTWDKPLEVIKEPDVCSASRNLLFSFPGCISVDGSGDRLFLSDVNHHRIIVLNSKGEILDAIGSSPGFEDGEFETAKLMRPASSFYDSSEDCLYFVDSENHAIRRADMGTRVVDTVFPASNGSQKGLWGHILDKLWTQRNTKLKSEEHDSSILLFPWHLLKSSKNDIFVLNQSFGTLWIVDLNLGLIREVIEESSKILEICGHVILEKCDPLRQIPDVWIKQQVDTYCSLEGIPYGGLMSSAASCQDDVIFCDEVGQRLVKFNKGSGSATTLCLSNFGILGLPYWLTLPIETMYSVDGPAEINIDHSECFRLLPGRVDIELTVDVPQHTDLVEVPQEECIWRQARGAAVEISGIEKQNAAEKVNRTQKFFDRIEGWILRQTRGAAAEISGVEKRSAAEKVSATQKFYDDFDNLFYISEDESSAEAENQALGEGLPEGRVRIGCTIYTSPGTSEVIVYAALYLRLKKDSNAEGDKDAVKAAMIADILEPKRKSKRDLLVKQLSERQGVEEVVFTRPLHVRLKFNCDNHPKGDDPVQTHSSVKAHVTL